jgi:hypothetical protein
MLGLVHCGIGGHQQAVSGYSIHWADGDTNAGLTMQTELLDFKRSVKATFQPQSDLLDIDAVAGHRNQHNKFIPAHPREHVAGAQLSLHAHNHFLKVQVMLVSVARVSGMRAFCWGSPGARSAIDRHSAKTKIG